ncbi:MarR family transcriptional regulator [Aliivibrio sp. 1S165]|uniref:MarR family winged helix-turn-helix transcriptional regulator n=1 Tax=unclassified Aliivibrio TaxID=2645654 RepID=UPI00080DA078|nr:MULTISPECIES: MarR family transcriptional regulator [unclassified Aliivibrio]OCH16661.1 MarR family transcriptional regulator [Aliivibrio sp. 1S165]OCH32886.1 MarR family transcriptional regulator [Aliivibrio sp. 1S175]
MSQRKSLDSLFTLVHTLKRNLHDQIEELHLGITPMHVRVIKIINHKPHCTAVDIANYLNRDKAQVTRLLSSLLTQELIIKEPNPEDKRSQCLRITESGKEIMKKISVIDKTMFEKMSMDLSEAEIAEFKRVAEKMASNLNS